jgi:hypothetical protein
MLSHNEREDLSSKVWKKVFRSKERARNAGIFSSNLNIFDFFVLALCLNLYFQMFCCFNIVTDNERKDLSSKVWIKVISSRERARNAEIFSSNLKIFDFFVLAVCPNLYFQMFCCFNIVTDNERKDLSSKVWKKVISSRERARNAEIFSSNLKIFNFFVLAVCPNLYFQMFCCFNMLSHNEREDLSSKIWKKKSSGPKNEPEMQEFFLQISRFSTIYMEFFI